MQTSNPLGSAKLSGQLAASGNIPLPGGPQAHDQLVKEERVAYAALIKRPRASSRWGWR
ncbi:hypothetical protein [Hydrogenophaga sp. BPS33]|uniref:hypothetical protein n=1 Tax=Hydrogenophaga sp. BPS33 TaxID=2651974 RepID=UPI001357767C|nr:hypothetical protein [Hydrogenophaga sp. BPS33]